MPRSSMKRYGDTRLDHIRHVLQNERGAMHTDIQAVFMASRCFG